MLSLSGRTTMSSRGQLVVPKAIREAAGLNEGDQIDLFYDGQRVYLVPVQRLAGDPLPGDYGGLRFRELPSPYAHGDRVGASEAADVPQSVAWADRWRALSSIKRLQTMPAGPGEVSADDILSESRRELEERCRQW